MAAEEAPQNKMYSSISGDQETKLRAAAVGSYSTSSICQIFQPQFPQALVQDPTMAAALGEVSAVLLTRL